MISGLNPDDKKWRRVGALAVSIDKAHREKRNTLLEENAHLHDLLSAANRDIDTARAERNLMLWCCVVLLCTACWLAGRVLAIGAGQ